MPFVGTVVNGIVGGGSVKVGDSVMWVPPFVSVSVSEIDPVQDGPGCQRKLHSDLHQEHAEETGYCHIGRGWADSIPSFEADQEAVSSQRDGDSQENGRPSTSA